MQGFLFNLSSGEYVFNVGLGQDHERVRIWLDGMILVNEWDSLTGIQTSSSYTLNSEKKIVEVQVEYQYDFASTGLQIMWMGPGFGIQVVQSIFFDGGVVGSPFDLHMVTSSASASTNLSLDSQFGSANYNLLLDLIPIARLDSPDGEALTYQLQIRDAFGNIIFPNCESGVETFCSLLPIMVSMESTNNDKALGSRSILNGNIFYSFVMTVSGLYSIKLEHFNFNSLQFVTKTFGNDLILDSSFVSSILDSPALLGTYPQVYTLSGFIVSRNAGLIRFGLRASTRAQLYIDNELVIEFPGYSQENESFGQKWFPSNFPLSMLLVHQVTSQADADLKLVWSYGLSPFSSIPVSSMYYQANLARAYRESVLISHSLSDLVGSVLFGDGMSLVVANTESGFHVLARDHFKNTFCKFNLDLYVSLSVGGMDEQKLQPLPLSGGTFDVFYPASISAGSQNLVLSQMIENSISSTFYDVVTYNPILTDNYMNQLTKIVMESTWTSLRTIDWLQAYIIRWLGFVRPSKADDYSFFLKLPSEQDRVKLWIDSQLKIDMWSSLSNLELSADHAFQTANQYCSVQILFRQNISSKANGTFQLRWYSLSSSQNSSIIIYSRKEVINSSVQVRESWTHCWSQNPTSIGGSIIICKGNAFRVERTYLLEFEQSLEQRTLPSRPINSTHVSFLLPPFLQLFEFVQLIALYDETVIQPANECQNRLQISGNLDPRS